MTHHTHDQTCQPQHLASSPLGSISSCPHCAAIHLTLGQVTLRLSPEAFRDLGHLMAQAQASLASEAPKAAAPFVMRPVGRLQ